MTVQKIIKKEKSSPPHAIGEKELSRKRVFLELVPRRINVRSHFKKGFLDFCSNDNKRIKAFFQSNFGSNFQRQFDA